MQKGGDNGSETSEEGGPKRRNYSSDGKTLPV